MASKDKKLEDSNKRILEAQKKQIKTVQKIMKAMDYTAEEAMELLEIDDLERPEIKRQVMESHGEEKE